MTFWTYLFVNTVLSLTVAVILIWTKPENRAKRAEAKMRREEDLFNMILEAAKRIDWERKQNPEFTPPPEKKPHGYYLTMTTDDAKDYGKTHTFNGEEYERTMVAQSADGAVVSMIYSRKYPQPIQSFFGEIRGGIGNEVLGTVTAKSEEELKAKLEAFSKQPITVFDSEKERWETKQISPEEAKTPPCKLCKHYASDEMREKYGYCVRNDEIMWAYDRKGCFEPKPGKSIVRPKPLGTKTTH